MSVQHQGVGKYVPSRTEREAKANLWVKNEQNMRFRQLFPGESFLHVHVLCI